MYGVASLVVTAVVLPLLGIIAVILRLYIRLRLKPDSVGIDDWLIIISIFLVCGQAVIEIIDRLSKLLLSSTVLGYRGLKWRTTATLGELGRDSDPIDATRTYYEGKTDRAVIVYEKATYTAIKLSVLFFYWRIFGVQRSFRIINDILIVLIIIWGIVFAFLGGLLCSPESTHGHPCSATEWEALWFGITDVLGDIAILALPYPSIRKLQMRTREKWGLAAVFMLGFLSFIIGIVRIGVIAKTFSIYVHPSTSKTSNNRTPPNFWTTVGVSIGVFAACLPSLRPLLSISGPQSLLRTRFLPGEGDGGTEGGSAQTLSGNSGDNKNASANMGFGSKGERDEVGLIECHSRSVRNRDAVVELREIV